MLKTPTPHPARDTREPLNYPWFTAIHLDTHPTNTELFLHMMRFQTRVRDALPLEFHTFDHLLALEQSRDQAKKHVTELKHFFLSGINLARYVEQQKYTHASGLTILEALDCFDDFIRTYKFLEGLYLHLDDLRQKRHDELSMVDAGCGPLPLYALMAAFKDPNIRVTCLEINPVAVAMARDMVQKFGFQDRIEVLHTDATKYQHTQPIDLLISETMNVGLTGGEHLAQIFRNLAPQVREDGALIPEAVTIDFDMKPYEDVVNSKRFHTKLPLKSFDQKVPTVKVVDTRHPPTHIEHYVPLHNKAPGKYALLLGSRVVLHEPSRLVLETNESTITTPIALNHPMTIPDYDFAPSGFTLSYKPGDLSTQIQRRLSFSGG